MNLHDIKYKTMEELRPKKTLSLESVTSCISVRSRNRRLSLESVTSCITAFSRNRRKSSENLKFPKKFLIESSTSGLSEFSVKQQNSSNAIATMSDTSIYGEEGEEGAAIRRTSFWTEETVQELYGETAQAVSRRDSCWTVETVQDL
mmetsp:Transcript_7810/g.11319  ORF Transcript_7810/g.11319 Transcript_7810/m.11319 type:complete len:147 (-) Transcript_7810:250-690(-)